jgi:hypothetical protein
VAETTHTLITDEDTEAFRVALCEGLARHGVNGGDVAERDAFEAVASRLRARWVAEALEELAGRYPADVFPAGSDSRDAISGTALRTVLTAQAKLHRAGIR